MWDDAVAIRYATIESLRADCESHPYENCPEWQQLRDRSRQATWVAGRTLATKILRELRPEWRDKSIEIRSRNSAGQGIAPQILVDGTPQNLSLSISHSDRGVFVAVVSEATVGVDLVDMESFTPDKLTPWFTEAELQHLASMSNAPREQATFWAVKEAVYKAVNDGESFAPKALEVTRTTDSEYTCRYRGDSLSESCRVRANEIDGHIAVMVVTDRRGSASPA